LEKIRVHYDGANRNDSQRDQPVSGDWCDQATSRILLDHGHYQMAEAFRAAERIPENVTARQAAHAFTHWLLHEETDPGAKMPSWFGPPTPSDWNAAKSKHR
jgi:hypothetical protein